MCCTHVPHNRKHGRTVRVQFAGSYTSDSMSFRQPSLSKLWLPPSGAICPLLQLPLHWELRVCRVFQTL